MGRPRNPTPQYRPHRGKARVVWTDINGKRQFVSLPGDYGSEESRKAYARLLLEIQTEPMPEPPRMGGAFVADLIPPYLAYAERHYRDAEGKPTSELSGIRRAAMALNDIYGDTLAAQFGPLALKAVRHSWVQAGLSRSECNRRARLVKRLFKWAAAEELIPTNIYLGLGVVSGLQKGRTPAPESKPIGPVSDAEVDATLPHLNRFIRGLIEVQRLTGCRPGEACVIRQVDIDTSGSVWVYRPKSHKTAHRGKTRGIAIGPKCQAVIREFFTDDPNDYLFSPRRAVEEFRAARTANRKTPRWRSHVQRYAERRKKHPKRAASERYTNTSYPHAVMRACDRLHPPPPNIARAKGETRKKWLTRLTPKEVAEVKAWEVSHRWHPNQLRHTFATRVRKEHGLEAAQVMLGHARADVTQLYAERNETLAIEIAAKLG